MVILAYSPEVDWGMPKEGFDMSGEQSPDAKRTAKLYERADRLREMMLRKPGLLERVEEGRRAAGGDEVVPLAEVERRLAEES